MNPFHQALQSGLESYMNIVKAAYAPQQTAADINYKNALADISRGNFANLVAKNPVIAQSLGRSHTVNAPDNGNNEQPVVNIPSSSDYPYQANQPNEFGGSNTGTKSDVDEAIKRASNSTSTPTQQEQLDSWYATNFPNSPEGIQAQARIERAKKKQDNQEKLWGATLDQLGAQVKQSQNIILNIDKMREAYNKLHHLEKGPVFGHGPAVSNAAKEFDTYAESNSTNIARALQQGHITDADFRIASRIKPNRTMPEQAFNDIALTNRALAQRDAQAQKFMSDMYEAGVDKNIADKLFNQFVKNYPVYNVKTGKVIDKNLKIDPVKALRNIPEEGTDEGSIDTPANDKVPGQRKIWRLNKNAKSPAERYI